MQINKADIKAEGKERTGSKLLILSRIGQLKLGTVPPKKNDSKGSNMHVVSLEAITRLVKASREIISNYSRVQLVRVTLPAFIKALEGS